LFKSSQREQKIFHAIEKKGSEYSNNHRIKYNSQVGKLFSKELKAVPLEPFKMERIQSEWENVVSYNLSESGVEPVKVMELISMLEGEEGIQSQVLERQLGYPQTNGTEELRGLISEMYQEAGIQNVIVTNGTSEANYIATWKLFDQKDEDKNELVLMLPNYMQIPGLAKAFGAKIRPLNLRKEGTEWIPDLDALQNIVSKKTRAIAIVNPNNPTGAILDGAQQKVIAELAADFDVWILSDEVYQGAELEGPPTPTMYDFYDKVLVISGLSKAYGLPGLRIGWIVSHSDEEITDLWKYKDYTSISHSNLSDLLARIALHPEVRTKLIERTRSILQTNWPVLNEWFQGHGDLFKPSSPKAGAIAFVQYHLGINSTTLVERLIHEKSVLVVPGDHFGYDHHLRIGYGPETEYLIEGLALIHELLEEIKKES